MLIGDKAELMKNVLDIPVELIIEAYKELKSSYKVAKKFNTSATTIKRILKDNGVLRNQKDAAKQRENNGWYYKRTDEHKEKLSSLGKTRTNDKNPFYGKTHNKSTKKKLSNYAKLRTQERNPNYKNGTYQRRPRDFKQAEFTRLRNFIFNRDEYTCKYCGCIGGHLHAHHKIPYWINSDAFLDPSNLITTCTACHFKHAHLGNWSKFDINLIEDYLIERYSLDRERLNELAANTSRCDSPTSTNNIEGGEVDRNAQPVLKKT